ncbi:helix-turn-helix domain-containing protein [Shewanella sp. D64]|uniref:helix-turn-helix domain-containing protein n=1 Tax=unclassified Shewanella TaxID=196818 RepID=UPI0022BA2DCC|nr:MULTISPECIES: helix-turn-helix transcriptional regulator [unclassified Shewanella]MEC4729172.1 helix-turn-helix domain-containing protein [Shewanella sp. D64]MEC4740955.1 helix-turn-helix domain-containing protein [Shewanella sp. E94]WBJ95725.1 helix-turn-helix domain-containing protein [Shewanella sp. MTB7]
MDFNEKLRAIIKEERLSQREFAELTGISTSSLEKYLSGRQEPKTSATIKIVNHVMFEKYTLWLMTGKTKPEYGQVCPACTQHKLV